MPAVVQIDSGHVNSGSTNLDWNQNASQVRFKAADNDTVDTLNPLVKPTGSNITVSWEKVFRLNVTTAPSNSLSNLRFHRVTQTLPTGISDYCAVRTAPGSTPLAGLSTATPSANFPVSTQSKCTTTVPTSATAIETLTSGVTYLTFGATTGVFGPYLYIQWRIDSTASPGTTSSITYRWTFDEA